MAARLLPVALACAALAVTGCGDDSGDGGAPAGSQTVQMGDYKFEPRDVTVRRGATVHVTNEGEIAHNLKVVRKLEADPDELAGTDSFLPGDSENLTVELPAGRYAMVCTVPGHRELGMTGTFTVQ